MSFNPEIKNKIWFYNIVDEQKMNNGNIPNVIDDQSAELIQFQEQQMLFLADLDDLVVINKLVDDEFLNYLSTFLSLPKIVDMKELTNLHEEIQVYPFINSSNVKNYSKNIFGPTTDLALKLNDKLFVRNLVRKNDFNVTDGYICDSIDGLVKAYDILKDEYKRIVIKSSYGSSAKGIRVIKSEKEFNRLVQFIERRKGNTVDFIIEGWIEDARCINSQIYIKENGIEIINITEQIIDENGVYIGTNYLPNYNEKILTEYKNEIKRLGDILYHLGYRGVCGVDSIISKNIIYPVIEINARFTQVTYLSEFVKNIIKKDNCTIVESNQINFKTTKYYNFNEFKEALDQCINPDSQNNYYLYTYGVSQKQNIYSFRAYLLFYGSDPDKVKNMLFKLKQFDLERRMMK
ncbi:ATP-grasp domain-containing protein [Bacillus toyonensis]|uniref:ATP-grasp domain-containing protein n=1 Tax=Bacillus toyonensis TaxID=155322 RepID=UPI0018CFF7D3|nr:ATP-grasp domain-containing protein [Bacillus toyonensis]MBH0357133.1 hypothetical protein [Bacillus toyonensis biovar Thuringiensis]